MGILDEIIEQKKREVAERSELHPVKLLEKSVYFKTPVVSLGAYLDRTDRVGIIAEIKRRSPSKGVLNPHISIEKLSIGYMQAGASALSILTDPKYFGGSNDDLTTARKFNFCPILRKDFVIDEYQLIEAKSIGADVVLLIARVLAEKRLQSLSRFAKDLGLEVLIEVHNEREVEAAVDAQPTVIGVNNRDLDTLGMDLDVSFELAAKIPPGIRKISESGISDPQAIVDLKRSGFNGFLIGESFMTTPRPEHACRKMIDEVRRILGAVDILE